MATNPESDTIDNSKKNLILPYFQSWPGGQNNWRGQQQTNGKSMTAVLSLPYFIQNGNKKIVGMGFITFLCLTVSNLQGDSKKS